MHSRSGNVATTPRSLNGTVFLHSQTNLELQSIFIDWTQALIAIENNVKVSTDYEIKNCFAYVTIRGKSGPVCVSSRHLMSLVNCSSWSKTTPVSSNKVYFRL